MAESRNASAAPDERETRDAAKNKEDPLAWLQALIDLRACFPQEQVQVSVLAEPKKDEAPASQTTTGGVTQWSLGFLSTTENGNTEGRAGKTVRCLRAHPGTC